MLPRLITSFVAVLIVGGLSADVAHAQKLESPLQLPSVEWLVADSDVIVRGVVADVGADQTWNIVTFDVREVVKGPKVERVSFALQRFVQADAMLAGAKETRREEVWILKRQPAGASGEAPDRERVLARHKIDLYAPFLQGRPGQPTLPVIPLADDLPPALLNMDLKVLSKADEIVAAIRAAVAEPSEKTVRSYAIAVPEDIAKGTGFSRANNHLIVPVDRRLEVFARRLVQSPHDFLATEASKQYDLRLEGVKALRLFPTEKNLGIVRVWLDNPMSPHPFKHERSTVVPVRPLDSLAADVALPESLADVPEIHFQQPLTKAMKTADAQLHTAVTVDGVHFMNQKHPDAFIDALKSSRPDLAGLPFAMGKACRLVPEASRNFVAALDVFRKLEDPLLKETDPDRKMSPYREQVAEKKIDPSASISSLMQVLGHEAAGNRFALAKYLDGLPTADSTRALAKLAIFSEEADIRAAAVDSLRKRQPKDYTETLLAGLTYPWPAVAERASDAIVKLGRKELAPKLVDMLEAPDPRAPRTQDVKGKKVTVVRELVRLNHHHNCLLCHAPATLERDKASKEEVAMLEGLTAQIPIPSESMVAYYRPSSPDILVRFDVTYLRQDFSTKLPVANADPWPEMQRYDFLVRTRELNDDEVRAYNELFHPTPPKVVSPYRRAALSGLRGLTGRDAEPTAAAWRKLIGG